MGSSSEPSFPLVSWVTLLLWVLRVLSARAWGQREKITHGKVYCGPDLEDTHITSYPILSARNEIRILFHLTTKENAKLDIGGH